MEHFPHGRFFREKERLDDPFEVFRSLEFLLLAFPDEFGQHANFFEVVAEKADQAEFLRLVLLGLLPRRRGSGPRLCDGVYPRRQFRGACVLATRANRLTSR